MTSVFGIGSAFTFNKSMFSNPGMRPYLQEYYENAYAPMRERIAAMKADEENGIPPKTVMLPDGQAATMLSADQMEAIIPSFDRWLEMQENFSAFDMAEQSTSWMKFVKSCVKRQKMTQSQAQWGRRLRFEKKAFKSLKAALTYACAF